MPNGSMGPQKEIHFSYVKLHGFHCNPLCKFNRSNAVVLLWFSVAFGVRVSVTFHLKCVYTSFSSVSVAEWQPFGIKLLTRLSIRSLCMLTICNTSYFPFWF